MSKCNGWALCVHTVGAFYCDSHGWRHQACKGFPCQRNTRQPLDDFIARISFLKTSYHYSVKVTVRCNIICEEEFAFVTKIYSTFIVFDNIDNTRPHTSTHACTCANWSKPAHLGPAPTITRTSERFWSLEYIILSWGYASLWNASLWRNKNKLIKESISAELCTVWWHLINYRL